MSVAEGFEEALSGGKEFLGGIPFLLAETVEARGPIGGLFALTFGGVSSLLLEQAGIEMEKPLGPIVFAGPVFDRRETFTKFVGDGLVRAGVAELEPGDEGAEGARGFAGEALEGELILRRQGYGGLVGRRVVES